ncbi:hypothetical protein FMEXI_10634 [Fusarium mexicanum]|uniref:Uncharacterized protein n=1 Tax=Fusarium mexicanum TaxID=751941 RepID=A0A8H5IEI3_9HYPO|nr:hypothetical protein FMEXI_10634 [Fusarium mexicanum]
MRASNIVLLASGLLASQASAGIFSSLICATTAVTTGIICHGTVTLATGGVGAVGCHAVATGLFKTCALATLPAP